MVTVRSDAATVRAAKRLPCILKIVEVNKWPILKVFSGVSTVFSPDLVQIEFFQVFFLVYRSSLS